MVKGIGTDMVTVSEMAELIDRLSENARKRMFSQREIIASEASGNKAEYLSTRFAAKEAVFKAIDPLLGEESFDFRIVETYNRKDGSPYIHVTEALAEVLERAGVSTLHISITTEHEHVLAFVVAE